MYFLAEKNGRDKKVDRGLLKNTNVYCTKIPNTKASEWWNIDCHPLSKH